jgi:PKD domain
MKSLRRSILSAILFLFPLLFVRPAAAQFAQITFPGAGDSVTGITLVSARQLMTSINPSQVGSVRFEYSSDGVSWTLIGVNNSPGNSTDTQSPFDWDILWDTSAVSPGTYRLRARFYLNNGLIFTSTAISITTSLAPIAGMSAGIGTDFVATFDGSSSSDPNPGGSIVSWDWDFGDGSTGVGPTSVHPYVPGSSYTVSLTVTNNRGSKNTTYREVLAFNPIPRIIALIRCIAKDITLRGAGMTALGNDGKGAGWPANWQSPWCRPCPAAFSLHRLMPEIIGWILTT